MDLEDLAEALKKKEQKMRERAEELGIQVEKEPAFRPEKEKVKEKEKEPRRKPSKSEKELTNRELALLSQEIRTILDTYTTEYIASHIDEASLIYESLKDIYSHNPLLREKIAQPIKEFKSRIDAVTVSTPQVLLSDAKQLLGSIDAYGSMQAKRVYAHLLRREQLLSDVDSRTASEIQYYLTEIGKTIQRAGPEIGYPEKGKPARARRSDHSRLRNYIIKRMLFVPPLLLVISFIVFILVYLCPGDAVDRVMGLEQVVGDSNLEDYLRMKEIFGLDQPWYIQYYYWLRQMVQGNLGYSFSSGRPVFNEIMIRIPNTLAYQVTALLLSTAVAIPAGVISALKRNTRTDTYIVMGSLFGASFPPFVTGLMLILLFTLILGWFPFGGTHSFEYAGNVPHDFNYYLDYLKHLVLPTLTLTLATVGYTTRLIRSSMLSVLQEDYIMTARSKGLKERTVIYKHALKNAILPIVTVIGLRAAFMLGGSPIVEVVFSWPGLGKYFVDAVWMRDYFSVIGASIVLGIFILIANLLVDLSYTWLDPRVKL